MSQSDDVKSDDVSGKEAATHREGKFTKAAREALDSEAPSAAAIGEAVAKALSRQAAAPVPTQSPLGAVVRASTRCQTVNERRVNSDGSARIVTSYEPITFRAGETADGKEVTLGHGKPVRLKREAFLHYAGIGRVVIAE